MYTTNKFYLLCMGIFIFYPSHGLLQNTTILLNEQLLARSTNSVKKILNLLKQIRLEFRYDYIVLVKDVVVQDEGCIFENIMDKIDEPILLLANLNGQDLQQRIHSTQFLLLSCSSDYLNQSIVFNTIYQYVKHVIWWEMENDIEKLCSIIQENGYFENLILTPDTLEREDISYFSCDFQNRLQKSDRLFTNLFLNTQGQGYTIVTEYDQLLPRSILYYDEFGELKLTGYVGNYLETFAERLNVTLALVPPVKKGVTIHYEYLIKKTFEGLLDIPAILAPLKMNSGFTESYSYPVEFMEYCYMIPLPHLRPAYRVFVDIIELKVMLIIILYSFIYGAFLNIGQYGNVRHLSLMEVILNDKSIRGLLGQSFVIPKKPSLFMQYICFFLYCSGLLFCTTYQAYLQTHLVHPSLDKRMETYEDIRQNNYKILVSEAESQFITEDDWQRNHDIIELIDNFDMFLKLRDNMDLHYIYPVSHTRWAVFQERQTLFQRKLFYYSTHLCLNKFLLLSFPLRPGLPYKALFDQHLMVVRDMGLLDHWLQHNFLTMVRLKYSSFKDLSVADEYGEILLVKDLLWIWILYGVCNLISVFVFIIELIYYKIKNNLK